MYVCVCVLCVCVRVCARAQLFVFGHSLDKESGSPGVDSDGVTDSSEVVQEYSRVVSGLESQLEKYKTSMKVCVCV